jgi:hypothetical protein
MSIAIGLLIFSVFSDVFELLIAGLHLALFLPGHHFYLRSIRLGVVVLMGNFS